MRRLRVLHFSRTSYKASFLVASRGPLQREASTAAKSTHLTAPSLLGGGGGGRNRAPARNFLSSRPRAKKKWLRRMRTAAGGRRGSHGQGRTDAVSFPLAICCSAGPECAANFPGPPRNSSSLDSALFAAKELFLSPRCVIAESFLVCAATNSNSVAKESENWLESRIMLRGSL